MTDRIRGLAFALVAALLLAAPLSFSAPVPVRAGVPVDDPDFAEIRDALDRMGWSSVEVELIAEGSEHDPTRDWFHPTRQPAGISSSGTDIVLSVAFEMELSPERVTALYGSGGMLACDNVVQVVCPTNRLNAPIGTEFYAYAIVTSTPFAPVADARQEFGAAAFLTTPPGGGEALPWVANPSFPDDFFTGANQAWVMRSDAGGPWSAFSLAHTVEGAGFDEVASDVTFWHQDRTLIAVIPGTETSGLQRARPFSFFARNGSFAPADSAADVYPEMAQAMLDVTDIPTISTTTTSGPSASEGPSTAPSQPGASAEPSPGAGGGGTTGGLDPGTALILAAGAMLLLLGGWLFFGRKKGDRCAELRAAWMAAAAACEEARRRAREAHTEAEKRAAEARAAGEEAAKARARREELQRLLDALNEGPDHGKSWAESEWKGKPLRIDEYDRMLREEAFAEANARYGDRLKKAGGQGERNEAHQQWQDELSEIDQPDYIEKLREKDAGKRAERIKKVEEELAGAKDAEAKADQAAKDAKASSEKAAGAAKDADAVVADVCARADAAEKAYRAECEPGPAGPKPADAGPPPPPEPPKPPEQPKPPDPGKPGEGGPPLPPAPGGGGGGGGETPPPKQRECPDGAEEWRPYGAKHIFLVPRPGKIQFTVTVELDEVTEWMGQWDGLDQQGHPNPDAGAGVPPLIFKNMQRDRVNLLFSKVKATRGDQIITIVLPLQSVTVQCERLWECRNGAWVQANQCHAVEEVTAEDKTFELKGNAVAQNEAVVLMTRAIAAWRAAEDAQKRRRQAGADCDACK